jgi:hypothetical protein
MTHYRMTMTRKTTRTRRRKKRRKNVTISMIHHRMMNGMNWMMTRIHPDWRSVMMRCRVMVVGVVVGVVVNGWMLSPWWWWWWLGRRYWCHHRLTSVLAVAGSCVELLPRHRPLEVVVGVGDVRMRV